MMIKIRIIVICSISILFNTNIFSQSIEIKWIGEKPTLNTGVSWGVPFAKNEVKKGQSFVLNGENKEEIAVQTWPLAYWPDGSIKWMGFAAVTSPQQKYNLNRVANVRKTVGLTVTNTADVILVNTGVLTCNINTKGNVLIKDLKVNGKTISENGKLVCKIENREKSDEQIIQYTDYESDVKEVVVEQSGPIRAVIKITGYHKALKSDSEILPFTVRLYFYAGMQTVRLVHTFIYDADQNKDFIKGLGIVFEVPFREQLHNRHVRFSGDENGLWSEPVKTLIGRYPFVYNGDKSLTEKQVAGERIPEITKSDAVAFNYYTNFPA